ncbi:sigma-54 interaction domain-containing protein [Planococcus sp. 1R117A]|uniref:sigma-54 interaction domain-containing protein n=1 Tax=Planococcus sp. 1R117A TaxID=3447020 RepID=UPI003EDB8895
MNTDKNIVEKLLETNFILLDALKKSEELSALLEKKPLAKIFSCRGNTWHCVEAQNANHSSTLCAIASLDEELESILKKVHSQPYTLVQDNDQQIIGYLTPSVFSRNLLNEYEQSQAYLETILDTIDESCTSISADKKVRYWTKGAEKIFSVKKEEIIGKPISDFFREDHLEILKTLKDGTSVHRRQHQARNDLVVLINSKPVLFKGEIIGAVVSETDITSQIRLNNELSKTSEKLFSLENEIRKTSSSANSFISIRGNSPALKKTMKIVEKAATTNASVLIYGESGVGKELFAKAIHNLRESEKAPFVAINCGAIPTGLFESEIFGYEKGAFSGADQKGKKGKVEMAKGGTLFLDEIAEMPLEMQVKILRLLQEKKFYPVGGTKELEIEFRVVAATNRDLKELVEEGKFREDLYYRLNVVNFKIPPLRERPEDIIELTHYFLYEISTKYKRPIHGISQAVMQSLLQHSWPGNIRELKNTIERLVVFSDNGEVQLDDLPSEIERVQHSGQVQASPDRHRTMPKTGLPLSEQMQEVEKEILLRALEEAGGNKQLCAKNLKITRATLYNRLNKLGIEV